MPGVAKEFLESIVAEKGDKCKEMEAEKEKKGCGEEMSIAEGAVYGKSGAIGGERNACKIQLPWPAYKERHPSSLVHWTKKEEAYMSSIVTKRAHKNGLDTKAERSRKQLKERKNREKKIRGVKKFQSFYRYHAKNNEHNKMTKLVAALCFKSVTEGDMKAATFFCIMFQGHYWRKYECRAIIMFRVPVPNIKATTF
nr:40S ribosomal protein S24-1 [Tanacetum cinerariifolium]